MKITLDKKETIKLLYEHDDSSDLYDDLWTNNFKEECANKIILSSYVPDTEYEVRLIGPYILTKRLYVKNYCEKNLYSQQKINKILTSDIIKKIYLHDEPSFLSTQDKLNDLLKENSNSKKERNRKIGMGFDPTFSKNPENEIPEAINFIYKLYSKEHWQKVILSNAIVKSNGSKNIKIISFNYSMFKTTNMNLIKNTTGVSANNLKIIKRGVNFNSTYTITSSKGNNFLDTQTCQMIINNGLYDIPKIIELQNNDFLQKTEVSYIFKSSVKEDYKMSVSLYNDLATFCKENIKEEEENPHIKEVEENINMLPDTAFENRKTHNIISGVEI